MFSQASSWVLTKQLYLAKKMNGLVKRIDENHPRFTRIVEITDRVNQTTFEMLKALGYGGVEGLGETQPIIIINEIDGRRVVIQGGSNGQGQD